MAKPVEKGRHMSDLPEEVKKGDFHRFVVNMVDCIFGLPRLFRNRTAVKADFDLTASFWIYTRKPQDGTDDAGK
jgi:hypothetical protein